MDTKTCTKCLLVLPVDSFSLAISYRDGRRSQCKSCRVRSSAERLARNPEKKLSQEKRRAYAQQRGALTADRLRHLLDYSPVTGVFTRKVALAKATKVGDIAGTVEPTGYIKIFVDGGRHFAHRLAWLYVHGAFPAGHIDHIDGDRMNNRIANLRDVDSRTNSQNIRLAKGLSGLLGASYHAKTGKWKAQIRVPGIGQTHLGLFDTAEDAHAAYLSAKRLLHAGCTI